MNVSMWMTRDPVTVLPHLPVAEAATLMAQKQIRRLLVVETRPNGKFVLGIVSAGDILRVFPPDINPFAVEAPVSRQSITQVGQIMRHELITTTPETPIEEAAALMRSEKIGSLPVLRKGLLAGLITESDVFKAFVGLFVPIKNSVRITFDARLGEDVLNLLTTMSQRDQVQVVSLIWTQLEGQPVCMVRVLGAGVEKMLDDLWETGHMVLNVRRGTDEVPLKKRVPKPKT
jgi:acetoin utilization protein AcuB